MDDNRVLIFDTTLRDGEQSPGISLNTAEKLEIAHQLARLNVDVIEAGFPIASPGDFEAVQAIARQVQRSGHRRAGPREPRRHRSCVGGRPRLGAAAHPHVRVDVGHPHRAPDAEHARGRARPRPRRGRPGAGALRRRRVLADGRDARRRRVHRRDLPDRDRRGRDDDQHPRHRRLHDAGRVHALPRAALRARARARGRRAVHALPRRPRAGRRQLVRRRARGRAAGRMRDQRDRRARGQRGARGDRDAAEHSRRRRRRPAHRDRHDRAGAHEPARLAPHRLPDPAEQGDRRAQRVRARVGHPPGRRAEGAHDVRDHGRDDRRPGGQPARAGQALRTARAAPGARGARLPRRRRRR